MFWLSLLFFLGFVPEFNGFHAPTPRFITHHICMNNENYKYAKEYYEFYNTYKTPTKKNKFPFLRSPVVNYKSFAKKHNETYSLFEKNCRYIQSANEKLKKENKKFQLDINQFADTIDLDKPNKPDLMNDPIIHQKFRPEAFFKFFQSHFPYLETIINQNKYVRYNWNDTKAISPIKNQGACGSCWAFSATSALESFMRINGYDVSRLSEQELVDCSTENYGCNGGLMHLAFDYIIEDKGLTLNKDYEYVAEDQNCTCHDVEETTPWKRSCKIKKAKGSNMKDYKFVIPKSVTDLKLSVMKTPVCIALDADNIYFRFYKSGVIDVPRNETIGINHAVLLVGFDYDEDGMYWIIANSWGEQWGDNGFCKVRVKPDDGVLLCQQYGVYPSLL